MMRTLTKVSTILVGDAKYWPLFMWSQKIALKPSASHVSFYHRSGDVQGALQVNQLAKSDAIKLSRLLKTGIASAMIHASNHTTAPIAIQEPVATQSRLCMRSLLRKIRT